MSRDWRPVEQYAYDNHFKEERGFGLRDSVITWQSPDGQEIPLQNEEMRKQFPELEFLWGEAKNIFEEHKKAISQCAVLPCGCTLGAPPGRFYGSHHRDCLAPGPRTILGSEEGRLAGLHNVSASVSGPCVLHVPHFIIIRTLQDQCECPDHPYEHIEL